MRLPLAVVVATAAALGACAGSPTPERAGGNLGPPSPAPTALHPTSDVSPEGGPVPRKSIAPGLRAASPPPVTIGGVTFGPLQPAQVEFVAGPWSQGDGGHQAAAGLQRGFPLPDGIAHGNYQFTVEAGRLLVSSFGATEGEGVRAAWLGAAELPGTNGSFDGIVLDHLRPYVLAWDPDAVLSRAIVPPAPAPLRLMDVTRADLEDLPVVSWPVVFISEARQESLTMYVAPGRIVALLVHWEGASPSPSPRVSEAEARHALEAALRDPAARSVEEVWGQDYFLGVPFRNPIGTLTFYGGPGPTMPGVARSEPLYTETTLGEARLDEGFGRTVWRFEPRRERWSEELPYDLAPDGTYRVVKAARGIVDADSGAVVRFSRSFRDYFVGKPIYPSPPAP